MAYTKEEIEKAGTLEKSVMLKYNELEANSTKDKADFELREKGYKTKITTLEKLNTEYALKVADTFTEEDVANAGVATDKKDPVDDILITLKKGKKGE